MQFCSLSDGVLTHLRWSEQSWPGAETRLEISWWNFHHRGEAARQEPSFGAALHIVPYKWMPNIKNHHFDEKDNQERMALCAQQLM